MKTVLPHPLLDQLRADRTLYGIDFPDQVIHTIHNWRTNRNGGMQDPTEEGSAVRLKGPLTKSAAGPLELVVPQCVNFD